MTALTFAAAVPPAVLASVIGLELKAPDFFDRMPFPVEVFLGVLLVPPIETAALQWAPIVLCTRRLALSQPAAGLISAILFGLMHSYSLMYVLITILVGVVLSCTFFLAVARNESPFWMVTAVHAARNFVSLAYLAIQ